MKAKAMAMATATATATAQLSQSLSAKKPPTQSRKQISKQLVRQNCRPKNARAADKLTAFWFWVFGLVWLGSVNGIHLLPPVASLSLLGLIKMLRADEWAM